MYFFFICIPLIGNCAYRYHWMYNSHMLICMSSIIFINCEKCKTVLLKPFRASVRSILIQKEYDKWFYKIAGDVLVDGGVVM